jgi:hypothetical protein
VELRIISLNSESINLGLKCGNQSIFLPVFALSICASGTLTFLVEIFVESENKIAFEDG